MRTRASSILCVSCVLACGDGDRADATDATTRPQVTSVSDSFTTGSGTPTTGDSGPPLTTGEPTGTPTGASGSDDTGQGATSSGSSGGDDSGPGDPSAGETGFDTGGFECTKSLQVTVRDFKVEHPDFEDFTSETGLKGLVEAQLGPDIKPVYAAAGPTAQTAGPEQFSQWYNNAPDTNIAFAIDIALTEVEPGLFSFESDAFFPIDGQGWGDQGQPHNFHFTTEIHTEFNYQGGEVFTFIGDDDLWLFINGRLAIDLGGVHPELTGSVDLDAQADALGIAVGGTYAMDIFHAERHTVDSHFRIDTSIQCFLIPG